MESKFELFNYKNLGSVRIDIDQNGNPWFCLVDICNILGLTNITMVTSRLNSDGLSSTEVIDNLGRTQTAIFVDEGNLYEAIGRSRKPEAKTFMNWVYREVLPSIRKNGYYTVGEMSELDILHRLTVHMMNQKKDIMHHTEQIEVTKQTVHDHGVAINNHAVAIKENRKRINLVMKEGYYTIAAVAKLQGIPLSLETAKKLGKTATKICEDHNIAIGTIPHSEYGRIHVYPYKVVSDVLADYMKANGVCIS